MVKFRNLAVSPYGSFFLSSAVHLLLVGSVLLSFNVGFFQSAPPTDNTYEDTNYDWVDAPPEPTKENTRIRSAPTKVVQQPTEKTVDKARELQDDKSDIAGTKASQKEQANLGAEGEGTSATTPYYKVKPKYPRRALASGVEGWILMKVNVATDGSVSDVRVVSGENRGEFQGEAQRAVEKWKYRPFLSTEGKPIEKIDHMVRVDFKIEDY